MTKNKNFKKKFKQSIVLLMSLAMIATTAGSVFASEEAITDSEEIVVDTEETTVEDTEETTEVVEDTEGTIEVTEDVEEASEEETSKTKESASEEAEHTEHSFSEVYLWSSGHLLECSICGKTIEEEHNLVDDVCTVCGYKDHVHHTTRTIVKSTTTEPGYLIDECTECTYYEWYEIPVKTDKDITSVSVTINEPVYGETASTEILSVETDPEGALDGLVSMWWTKIAVEDYTGAADDPQENVEEGEAFTTGYYYIANIAGVLSGSANAGKYEIAEDIDGFINGRAHDDTYGYACQTWTRLYLCTVYAPLEAEHTFGDWTVTKEATYTEPGLQERTCTGCGYVETEEIEKIAHEHAAASLTITDTEHSWTCKLCGEVYNAGPHEYGEWKYVNESSDGTTKWMYRTCKCGEEEKLEVPVETVITSVDVTIAEPVIGEHPDFNPVIVTDPATDDVKLAYVTWFKYDPDNTNLCLGLLKETDVFEEGYVYGVWIQYNTYQTSAIFNGSTGTTFTLNGEAPTNDPFNTWERISYSVKFDKLEAHVHEYTYKSTKDGHYQICECGDETEIEDHSFGSWKNAGNGKQSHTCTVCGYTETQKTSTIIMNSIFDFFKNIFGFGSKNSSMMTNTTNNKAGNSIFANSGATNTTRANNMRTGRMR